MDSPRARIWKVILYDCRLLLDYIKVTVNILTLDQSINLHSAPNISIYYANYVYLSTIKDKNV